MASKTNREEVKEVKEVKKAKESHFVISMENVLKFECSIRIALMVLMNCGCIKDIPTLPSLCTVNNMG